MWEFRDFRSRVESVIVGVSFIKIESERERERIYDEISRVINFVWKRKKEEKSREREKRENF